MTRGVTIDDGGAHTLAGAAEDSLDGSSVERLPSAGEAIGRYVVLEVLGTGGMGVVYAAYDPELDRKVAVKLLRVVEGGSSSSGGGGARLLDEARALARLSHPNVIVVHDVGVHQARIFVAMEFVDGQTLSVWQRAERREPEALCRAYVAAGHGLAAAHRAGLVHRDFKPDNVMIDAEGRIRVLDFGLARRSRKGLRDAELTELGELRVDDPRTLGLVGTPAYMAPEQFGGDPVDARTDQFAFCVALYEALFGERPFHGDTVTALAWSVLNDEARVPAGTSIDPRIAAALVRGLSKKPEDRFASMEPLLRELTPEHPSRRPWWRLGGAALVGGTIGVAAIAAWPDTAGRCAKRSDVASIWGPDAREALRAALGEEIAATTEVASVEARLDRYADALSARLRRACEAEGEPRASTAQLSFVERCLERRQSALSHAVELLAASPDRTRARGVEIVGALPPVADCDDPESDEADSSADPARIELVDALETELDEVRLRLASGERDEPRAVIDDVLARAREHELHGVEANARFLELGLNRMEGRISEAAESGLAAFTEGLRAGRDGVALTSAARLAFHYAFDEVELDKADEWLAIAHAFEGRIAPSTAHRVELANAVATVAYARADYESALEAYTEAEQLCQGAQQGAVACVRHMLDVSQTLSRLGRREEALAKVEEALEVQIEARGRSHPQSAVLLNTHATALADMGRDEEALEQSSSALRLAEDYWGEDSPEIVAFLGTLSDAYRQLGRLDRAEPLLERVVKILEAQDPVDAVMMSYARYSQGALNVARSRFAEAAEAFGRSAELRESVFGAAHPLVRETWARVADARLAGRDPEAALEALAHVQGECAESGCSIDELMAKAIRVEALAAIGRHSEAKESLADLLAARDSAKDVDGSVGARVRVAELSLADPSADVLAERERLRARLLSVEGPGSPAAARLDPRFAAESSGVE